MSSSTKLVNQWTINFCLVLIFFIASACQQAANQKVANKQFHFTKTIKNSDHNPSENRSQDKNKSLYLLFDEVAESAQLTPLNLVVPAKSNFELRIWVGGGLGMPYGYRLLKKDGLWERGMIELEPTNGEFYRYKKISAPKMKWENIESEIMSQELITLKPCPEHISIDSGAYVVEIQSKGTYQDIVYWSQAEKECAALGKIEKLIEFIVKE